MTHLVFKPVRESLNDIKAATKSAIPDSQKRADVLRKKLTLIGHFITEQINDVADESQDVHGLEVRFWYD